MDQTNGYFQIEWRGTEGICHIYPPVNNGQPVEYKELSRFLDRHGFEGYNGREISQLLSTSQKSEISVGQGDGIAFSESMDAIVSLDKMKVTCRFYPPSIGGNLLTVDDLLADLKSCGVKFGISREAIQDFMMNRCYCTDYLMAEGKMPVHGRDAKIEYYFNTNPSLKPKHNEDGSVDYHDLNTICPVKEGDLLAKLYPEERGEPGTDITGRAIPPRSIRTLHLQYGKNIRINEEQTELYSEVTGHVSLYDDKVFVADVYDVPADVDNSTGDIKYDGNVHIKGNVKGGFIVRAKGDIVIDGVVEDAMVQSEGNIIIKCGIHGMQKGVVKAGGNLISKFIENATVSAGGYIETGSIIGSNVSAGDDILVEEKKGFITGGTIRAGGKVEAYNIGSPMGAATMIEVGTSPEKKERYNLLQQEITKLNQSIAKITPVMQSYAKYVQAGKQLDAKNMIYYTKLKQELKEDQDTLKERVREFTDLHRELSSRKNARVSVRRDIHPGVTITISDISYTLKTKRSFCYFEKRDGEIAVMTL